MCMCECTCTLCMPDLGRWGQRHWVPWIGVVGIGCEPPDVRAGNRIWVFTKNSSYSVHSWLQRHILISRTSLKYNFHFILFFSPQNPLRSFLFTLPNWAVACSVNVCKKSTLFSWRWWYRPGIIATGEAKAGGCSGPRLAWAAESKYKACLDYLASIPPTSTSWVLGFYSGSLMVEEEK